MDEITGKFFMLNEQILQIDEFIPEIINYGTTLYELIKVQNCVPVFVEKYMERLKNSAKIIGQNLWLTQEIILDRINYIINLNCAKQTHHLKLLISFDNDFYGDYQNLFIAYFTQAPVPSKEQYQNGVRTITFNAQRINPNAKVFIPQLRQQSEELIQKYSIYEAILLDNEGNITEGSRSNVFFVKNNELYTAAIHQVLPGITRSNVIELAKANKINVHETQIKYSTLDQYEAAFLTGTSRKIVPINSIDNYRFDPKNALVRRLMQLYDQKIEAYVEAHKNKWQCPGC